MPVDTQLLKGADDLLDKLKSLPAEIGSKRGGPMRIALLRGAQVIQRQAQANIRNIVEKPDESGYVSTGTLEGAVVVRRDPHPERSGANERYRILISKRTYPDGTKVVATGRYLEYGTEMRAPTPWMSPAYFSRRQEAIDTVVNELNTRIARIIRKLERQGAR